MQNAATSKPKKKGLKMPHLLVLILSLLVLMSLMTYIIPAGQFGTDPETGAILSDQFHLLGYQTPVNPWRALNPDPGRSDQFGHDRRSAAGSRRLYRRGTVHQSH